MWIVRILTMTICALKHSDCPNILTISCKKNILGSKIGCLMFMNNKNNYITLKLLVNQVRKNVICH